MSTPLSMPRRSMLRVTLKLVLAALCTLVFQTALATPLNEEFGQLMVAKGVTVDGIPATGGLTVISGSRIKTQTEGRAILNLGKLGRVQIGAEAEIALKFAEGSITGELVSGWAVFSSPKGVDIAIKTTDGTAVADGDKPSVLRIDLTGGTTRVEVDGAARLSDGTKTEFVAAGEEVELSRETGAPVYARRALETPESEQAVVETIGWAEMLAAGLRATVESVVLDRTVAAPGGGGPSGELARRAFTTDTRTTNLTQQEVSCGEFNELCGGLEIGCFVFPQIIKAKAGCALQFIIRTERVQIPAHITIRPFFNNACFRLTPTFPQIITLNPGQGYVGTINAISCPRNANQLPSSGLIVLQSDTCGTFYIRVEWATPCR